MKNIMELPENLSERRDILKSELKKVVTELCFTSLKEIFDILFAEYKVNPKPASVTWEFHEEYDDEGGTDWNPTGVSVWDENEENIETEDYTVNKKSKWSDNFYDFNLDDEIYDILYEWKSELYEYGIEEIRL
jgi:hypothetical protein